MSRRKAAKKRVRMPDPKYGSEILSQFISAIMKNGKKSTAEKIVYGALEAVVKKLKGDAVQLLNKAFDNVRPMVEVRPRRVGGATYQVPIEVPASRQTSLAMRWIINAARARGEKGMMNRLAAEILDAVEGRGSAVKKKEDIHSMAKANQAFAHYRWN